MFTQTRQSVDRTDSVASTWKSHLPSGWSKDGLLTFNKLAKEVQADRDKHGLEFDMFFKKKMNEMAIVPKSRKRKIECVDIYNDLDKGANLTEQNDDNNDDESTTSEQWVTKNVFSV
jgi:hypothetical protein